MSYVIYNRETTRFVRVMCDGFWQDASYATKGAATAAFNRMCAAGAKLGKGFGEPVTEKTHAIAEAAEFHAKIEKWETKKNLLSGLEFRQPVNTPLCCDPSSETYHSM